MNEANAMTDNSLALTKSVMKRGKVGEQRTTSHICTSLACAVYRY